MIEEYIRKIVREELALITHNTHNTLTTEEVMAKYGIKSKATLISYHKQGLPYIKGRPNRYMENDIIQFFIKNRITR